MTVRAEKKLLSLSVKPNIDGFENVVAVVDWAIAFTKNGLSNYALVSTTLPLDSLSGFVPVEQLTKEQIFAWCEAQDPELVERLTKIHEQQLIDDERRLGLTKYTGPAGFAFDVLAKTPNPNEVSL